MALLIGSIVEDIRIAFRTLLKERGFTAITVLTLAVAIGANTAIFSVVDGVLLRLLPYPDADRVVTVAAATFPGPGLTGELPFSPRGYWHFVDNNRVFDGFGGYQRATSQMALTGDGQPLQVDVGRMTASAFEVLVPRDAAPPLTWAPPATEVAACRPRRESSCFRVPS